MDTPSIVRTYFLAERDLGIFLAAAGIAVLAFAVVVHRTQSGAFLWGLVIPLTIVGLACSFGGGALAARSQRQATELAVLAANDPQSLASEELPRMARVNANWPRIKALWAVTILCSLGAIFLVRRDGLIGTGLVLLATCSILMMIDTLAERRALVYTTHLRSLAP